MKLQEQLSRIKSMMGLLVESTEKISNNNGEIVLISDDDKNHMNISQ